MSRSITTTFFPVKAIIPAKLMARKVFPSPEIVLLTAIIFDFLLFSIN